MHKSLSTTALEDGVVTVRGGLVGDFVFYIRNSHLLLSVFCAHENHPYTTVQRVKLLANSLAFAILVVAICTVSTNHYWEKSLVNDWAFLRILALTFRDWPASFSIFVQVLFDAPGSMLSIYLAHNDATLPCWFRWTCGCTLLACSVANLCPAFLYFLLAVVLMGLLGPYYSPSALLQFVFLLGYTKIVALALAVPVGAMLFFMFKSQEWARRESVDSRLL